MASGCCATLTHQPTILKPQPPTLILLKSKIPLHFWCGLYAEDDRTLCFLVVGVDAFLLKPLINSWDRFWALQMECKAHRVVQKNTRKRCLEKNPWRAALSCERKKTCRCHLRTESFHECVELKIWSTMPMFYWEVSQHPPPCVSTGKYADQQTGIWNGYPEDHCEGSALRSELGVKWKCWIMQV